MKKRSPLLPLYIFLVVSGSVLAPSVFGQARFAVGERTVFLGGANGWNNIERTGVTQAADVRQHPVLVLSSTQVDAAQDLSISFNENDPRLFRDGAGRYRVTIPARYQNTHVKASGSAFARAGPGAALFNHLSGPLEIEPVSRNALFAPGSRINDFSIDFWLYPINMENGEIILSWVTPGRQLIRTAASRNRLHWTFADFFTRDDGVTMNIEFSGRTPIVPRTWSHHHIRFDSAAGMVEYLVNGVSEAIVYATPSGRESSNVFTPLVAAGGLFRLGENFNGLIDEFNIRSDIVKRHSLQRFPLSGGRIETTPIKLGGVFSDIIRVDVSGGRTGRIGNSVINEFRENGVFRFADASQLHFFVRAGDNPWLMDNEPWVSFTPGSDIFGVRGRYVQLAVYFYPCAYGEVTPYLENIRLVHIPQEPPLPPRNVTAIAVDGGVYLRWRQSPSPNTVGYLVYYSSVRGEFFGEGSSLGASPINVGMTNSVRIDGLRNGTLYFFRVAAYSIETGEILNIGEFSAEVTARPLIGL